MTTPTTIPVALRGFWPGYSLEIFRRCHSFLEGAYELVESDTPQVVFYSVFPDHRPPPASPHVRVFWTGERAVPDLDEFDFAISFEHMAHPRHLRLPNWVTRLNYYGIDPRAIVERRLPDEPARRRFCNFLYRNRVPLRERVATLLAAYKHVDAPGLSLNNAPAIGDGVEAKLAFLAEYKFTIAFENESAHGYITEKIVEAALAGTVPLYWGDPNVANELNPRSFVDLRSFASEREFVDFVIALDKDDELYTSILREPLFFDGAVPDYATPDHGLRFFEQIFAAAPHRQQRPVSLDRSSDSQPSAPVDELAPPLELVAAHRGAPEAREEARLVLAGAGHRAAPVRHAFSPAVAGGGPAARAVEVPRRPVQHERPLVSVAGRVDPSPAERPTQVRVAAPAPAPARISREPFELADRLWPPTASLKRAHLLSLFEERGHRVLVESGTYLGGTVEYFLAHADRITSVEIEPNLHRNAVERFSRFDHVEILFGDSTEHVPRVVAGLDRPPLVYLDGHSSGADSGRGEEFEPAATIIGRLAAAGTPPGTTIVVDDLRIFSQVADAPTLEQLLTSVASSFPHAHVHCDVDALVVFL